jgi:hypothetical protein
MVMVSAPLPRSWRQQRTALKPKRTTNAMKEAMADEFESRRMEEETEQER